MRLMKYAGSNKFRHCNSHVRSIRVSPIPSKAPEATGSGDFGIVEISYISRSTIRGLPITPPDRGDRVAPTRHRRDQILQQSCRPTGRSGANGRDDDAQLPTL